PVTLRRNAFPAASARSSGLSPDGGVLFIQGAALEVPSDGGCYSASARSRTRTPIRRAVWTNQILLRGGVQRVAASSVIAVCRGAAAPCRHRWPPRRPRWEYRRSLSP